jgi:hypothetical protein
MFWRMSLYCSDECCAHGEKDFIGGATAGSTHSYIRAANAWARRIRNPISFDISLVLLTLKFAGENRLRAAAGGDKCVRKGRF